MKDATVPLRVTIDDDGTVAVAINGEGRRVQHGAVILDSTDLRAIGDEAADPPFPVDTFDGSCPSCGMVNSVQHCEDVQHYRTVNEVSGGVLLIEGHHFDWGDEGTDEHLSCWSCGARWALPESVDYV